MNNFFPNALDGKSGKNQSRPAQNRVAGFLWFLTYHADFIDMLPRPVRRSYKMVKTVANGLEIGIAGQDATAQALAHLFVQRGGRVTLCNSATKETRPTAGEYIQYAPTIRELIGQTHNSRTIFLTGPDASGDIFSELLDLMESGDLLIDAAEVYFKDFERRTRLLAERNIDHLALGMIGTTERKGPVLFVGGSSDAYLRDLALLESIAAPVDGAPALMYAGAASAAPFFKMIYEGIEFALHHQAIETLELLQESAVLDDEGLHEATAHWPVDVPHSRPRDDFARWCSQIAHELGMSAPTVDAAAGLRTLSDEERQNDFATTAFRQPRGRFGDDPHSIVEELQGALEAAVIITYSQGLAVLAAGLRRYGYEPDVPQILALWQSCAGARSALLDQIVLAYEITPNLPNFLHDDDLSETVMAQQERLRHAVWRAAQRRVSVPALAASLDYLDAFRGAWLPMNLIQVPPRRIPNLKFEISNH